MTSRFGFKLHRLRSEMAGTNEHGLAGSHFVMWDVTKIKKFIFGVTP